MIPRQPTLFALEDGLDIQVVDEDDLQFQHIQELLDSAVDSCIGLAPIYGLNVALKTLTLASNTRALVVHFHRVDKAWIGVSGDAQRLLENTVLRDASIVKYAFTADKLVYTLAHWYGVRVSSTLSLLPPQAKDEFEPWALENCVRGVSSLLSMNLLADLFIEQEGKDTSQDDTVRQAWLAQYAGSSPARHSVPIVYDSSGLQYMHLQEASKLYCVSLQLRHLKPNVIENEIDEDVKVGTGGLDVTSARFKTRITQASIGQRLELMVSQGGREFSIEARTTKVEGRGARIAPTETLCDGVSIIHVKTHGREPPTNAEETRHRLLAGILQGNFTLFDNNHFVRTIFFPEQLTPWPALVSARERKVRFSDRIFLNRSQGRAVEAIISLEDRHRVVLIHGPPGTGKTTVIAAGTNSIADSDPNATVWLVAHSNVAVKNIAEKLLQSELLDFKIIVSKEFIFDWHEHLYQKFERNLIRTDSLPRDPYTAHRMLLGSRVILSTLSNLLNPNMMEVMAIVPVKTLIVDEASQIEVGDYLPVIHRFRYKLEKLVFIGDDKQLAPYGFEHIRELESIFEKRHLRMDAILLDTQYRMPAPIGNFISTHVYNGQVYTSHPLASPNTCRFVHISDTYEEKRGNSWVNLREAAVVVTIARHFAANRMAFKIITPYDPQRLHIEKELKRERIPHDDAVFNVDSFQGNESDYIIVSLVRSGNRLGFLQEERRVNVMLTRCKRGMVICSNRNFVEGVARESLVGKLATTLGQGTWIDSAWVLYFGGNPFH